MSARLLILEDDPHLGETLTERLVEEGYSCVLARSLAEARIELKRFSPELALVDVHLPDGNGMDWVKESRRVQPQMAVLFLTAMGSPEDKIAGLEAGAEDYVVKPFHLRELILRIKNVLKRAGSVSGDFEHKERIQIGACTLHLKRFELERAGEVHSLTHKEMALLMQLWKRKGEVVSRDEILDHVWSTEEFPTPRTVDNFVMRLRRWIDGPESGSAKTAWIKSVRGVGYQLVTEEEEKK